MVQSTLSVTVLSLRMHIHGVFAVAVVTVIFTHRASHAADRYIHTFKKKYKEKHTDATTWQWSGTYFLEKRFWLLLMFSVSFAMCVCIVVLFKIIRSVARPVGQNTLSFTHELSFFLFLSIHRAQQPRSGWPSNVGYSEVRSYVKLQQLV